MELDNSNNKERVITENKGKGKMEIDIKPALSSTKEEYANFMAMVETTLGIESTGDNAGDPYVEFKLKNKGCGSHQQKILVFSNGDSKGASDCDIKAGVQYLGKSHEARWNTKRCKKVTVKLTMPV